MEDLFFVYTFIANSTDDINYIFITRKTALLNQQNHLCHVHSLSAELFSYFEGFSRSYLYDNDLNVNSSRGTKLFKDLATRQLT